MPAVMNRTLHHRHGAFHSTTRGESAGTIVETTPFKATIHPPSCIPQELQLPDSLKFPSSLHRKSARWLRLTRSSSSIQALTSVPFPLAFNPLEETDLHHLAAVGFGTWQDKDAQEGAVTEALKAGYTHIDTARMCVSLSTTVHPRVT